MFFRIAVAALTALPMTAFVSQTHAYTPFEDSPVWKPLTRLPASKGDPAPDILVTDVSTSRTMMLSEFKGQILYLDFWASWCPACIPLMDKYDSLLDRREKDWKGRVAFVAMSLDRELKTVRRMAQSQGWKHLRLLWTPLDMAQREPLASRAFGIVELPYAVLIDASGTVIWRGNPLQYSAEEQIDGLLGTESPGAAQPAKGTLEPGQADTRVTATAPVSLPTEWSHPPIEARGVWMIGSELMGSTESLVRKLDALQEAGFNEVMLDTWLRGYVTYPGSAYVPQHSQAKGRDPLAWIIPEIRRRGMLATAWPSYGFYAYYTRDAQNDPSMGPVLDRHPDLAAEQPDGRKALHNPTLGDFYSLCPANPRSHEFLASLFVEQMTKYPFDGLNLDRMRFPSADYCHCAYCREAFRRDTGMELASFPERGTEAKRFLEWKREQNARSVARVVEAVRKARPDAFITAYAVPPAEMDSRAQSWDLWMKRGLLDAIAVSMYEPDIDPAARRAIELLCGSSRLICAINAEHDSAIYLSNVEKTRSITRLGQYTWYTGTVMDDIEGLKSGPYAKPATSPLRGQSPPRK